MRATIRIDDDLYRSAKERAKRTGRTVASVLEDAVRAGLTDTVPTTEPTTERFTLRSSGRGGLQPGVDLASNATVAEPLDEGRRAEALR